jgi:hypothetical protein
VETSRFYSARQKLTVNFAINRYAGNVQLGLDFAREDQLITLSRKPLIFVLIAAIASIESKRQQ